MAKQAISHNSRRVAMDFTAGKYVLFKIFCDFARILLFSENFWYVQNRLFCKKRRTLAGT